MNIKKGAIGEAVLAWQKFLIEKGFDIGALDGIFGSKVEAATKQWQQDNGLTADGIVGKASYEKAATQGFKYNEEGDWYPPRPDFESPTLDQVIGMFGMFSYKKKDNDDIEILGDWVSKNIVKVKIPQLIGVYGAPKTGEIYFHRKGVSQLKGLFQEIENQGLKDLIISWAGSFNARMVRGSKTRLSNHSWGSAFDINAPENWLHQKPAAVGKKGSLLKIVPIANDFGFYWGGHYRKRLDGMHFELSVLDRFPSGFTPED